MATVTCGSGPADIEVGHWLERGRAVSYKVLLKSLWSSVIDNIHFGMWSEVAIFRIQPLILKSDFGNATKRSNAQK